MLLDDPLLLHNMGVVRLNISRDFGNAHWLATLLLELEEQLALAFSILIWLDHLEVVFIVNVVDVPETVSENKNVPKK